MKINIKQILGTLGLVIATLTFSGCGTNTTSDGSHNMGNPRSYRPMPNSEMPNAADRH